MEWWIITKEGWVLVAIYSYIHSPLLLLNSITYSSRITHLFTLIFSYILLYILINLVFFFSSFFTIFSLLFRLPFSIYRSFYSLTALNLLIDLFTYPWFAPWFILIYSLTHFSYLIHLHMLIIYPSLFIQIQILILLFSSLLLIYSLTHLSDSSLYPHLHIVVHSPISVSSLLFISSLTHFSVFILIPIYSTKFTNSVWFTHSLIHMNSYSDRFTHIFFSLSLI